MERTYVRCDGRLSEPYPGAFECSLGLRCAVAMTLRSYWATGDDGLAQQVRDAHPEREGPLRAG